MRLHIVYVYNIYARIAHIMYDTQVNKENTVRNSKSYISNECKIPSSALNLLYNSSVSVSMYDDKH